MSRVQLALNVADLEQAVEFYSRFFGFEPVKVRPGYANFALANPPLKLVLIEDGTQLPGSLNHLGVEVETTEEVAQEKARLVEAGLSVTMEDRVTCCHALQDKIWVDGAGGHAWEIYTVLADSTTPAGAPTGAGPSDTACCASRPDLAGAGTASSSR